MARIYASTYANRRTIAWMHVFIQFLAYHNKLDAFLIQLMNHVDDDIKNNLRAPGVPPNPVFPLTSFDESRCDRMHDSIYTFVGSISWSDGWGNDSVSYDEWARLNNHWQRTVDRHREMINYKVENYNGDC